MNYQEIVDAVYAKYMLVVKSIRLLEEEVVKMDVEKMVEREAKLTYLLNLKYFYLNIIAACKVDQDKLSGMAKSAVETKKQIMEQMEKETDPKKLIDLVYELNTKNAILDGYNAVVDLIEEGQ